MVLKSKIKCKKLYLFCLYGLLGLTGCNQVSYLSYDDQGLLNPFNPSNQLDQQAQASQAYYTIFSAANEGNLFRIQTLIDNRGVDINEREYRTARTALHYTVLNGDLNTASYLINRGADLNLLDSNGCTPLDYANLFRNKKMAELLRTNGAKANVISKIKGIATL